MYVLWIPNAVLHSQRPPTSDLDHVPSVPILCVPNACPHLICTICYLSECCAFPTSDVYYMPSVRVLYLPNVRSALYAIYFNHIHSQLTMPRNQFLHSPVTRHTRRCCFLTHPVLEELVFTIPMPGNRFLHLPVTLRTWRYCFPAHSVLGEVVS